MRQFLKYVFATLVGIFLFCMLLVVFGAALASMASRSEQVTVKPNSLLKITLDQPIPERTATQNPSVSNLLGGGFNLDDTPGLPDITDAIAKAAADDNIKGIYLEASNMPSGWATLEVVRQSLADFKASGKFIVGYGEIITQRAYYIAAIADALYLNPEGLVELKGFSTQTAFIKNMLDKLDLKPEVFYAGNFKSATEPLRYTQMSDYNRLQTRELLADFYDIYLKNTAASRKMDPSQLHNIINGLLVKKAADAKTNGVVNDLFYIDQVHAELRNRMGLSDKDDLNFISLNKYVKATDPRPEKALKKEKIAVIVAEGDITTGQGEDNSIGSDRYVSLIRKARRDENVKAIVLRVNSGGGSALASEIIWRELMVAREAGIPIVASMGDVAASGGYYITTPAAKVFAEENTITGSIGVFGVLADASSFYKEKLGVTFDTVKTTAYSDFPTSPLLNRPLNESEKAIVQHGVEDTYEIFLNRVAEGRKKSRDQIHEIAQGRVWTGRDAKENGLIDEFGGLDDAIKAAAQLANLPEDGYRVRYYPETEDIWTKLRKELDGNGEDKTKAMLRRELGDYYRYYEQVKTLENLKGVQARMPFIIDVQ